MIHSDAVVDILKSIKVVAVPPDNGDGSVDSPYVPTALGHWYHLALLDSEEAPMFILVGGRLIARWGTGASKFVDYCTDVTAYRLAVDEILTKSDYQKEVEVIGQHFREQDELAQIDTDLHAYSRKALRIGEVEDRVAAHWSRNLLQGIGDCHECPELASSLCSLFIAEVHRVPEMFVLSLMLLDLVETATTYGSGGGKTYTWKSMLMHDTTGIPGRGSGMKGLAKHPMAGLGTVKLGKDLYGYGSGGVNEVRDRVISIMSVWLAHYMTKVHGGGGKYKFSHRLGRDPPHLDWELGGEAQEG